MAMDDDTVRLLLIIVAVVLLLPVFMMLFAGTMMGMGSAGHMPGGVWGGMAPFFGGLVLLAVLLGGGYLLYTSSRSREDTDDALEELRLAYARGELSDEEFEKRQERLQRD